MSERNPRDQAILARAFEEVRRHVEMPHDVEAMTIHETLVSAIDILVNDIAVYTATPYRERTTACGWCIMAAGDTEAAADAAPQMTLDEVRAHALVCEHNPLVKRLNEALDMLGPAALGVLQGGRR